MPLSRTPATPPLPSDTYLLAVDGIIQDTQLGFGWRDALDLLWSGDYNSGAPRLIHVDLAVGTAREVTVDALKALAARTFEECETPAHLASLLHWHRLPHFGLTDRDHDEAFQRGVPPLSVALGRRRALFGAYEG